MGITLPNAGNISMPNVPVSIAVKDPALAEYLQSLRRSIETSINDQFSNSLVIANVVNSGTSGTFTISSGGSIIITSGVVITVTS